VPRFDTPTREVASCERRQHLSLSRRLRAEGTGGKKSPQYCREDQNRPSKRDTWCAIRLLASSPLAALKIEDQPPPSRETRSAEGIQDSGPPSCRGDQNRPSKRDTWCAIRLLASSPLAALKIEDQPPPSRETRSAEGIQDSGPPSCRGDHRPSRGTRGARLGSSPFRPSRL
jgi:hypothetical protein